MSPEEKFQTEASVPNRDESPPAMFRRILVPLDGSTLAERALPFALAIAQALSTPIALLRVLRPYRGAASGNQADPFDWEMLRAHAHSYLASLENELKAHGVAVTQEVVQGRAAEQIIQFAKNHEVDLIVLTSHAEGGLTGWALSSTVQKVVARATTSILIVPAYAQDLQPIGTLHFNKLLVPLDCSQRAESILPLAKAMVRTSAGTVILAHVVPTPELPRLTSPSQDDLALAELLTERNRSAAEDYLSEVREQTSAHGVKSAVRIVVSPRRAGAICALAAETNADLVLVCAHGNTGDPTEHYGSTTAWLIQRCGRPVLVFQDLAGCLHDATPADEAARGHPGH